MSNVIRELVCKLNRLFKPDHFVYPRIAGDWPEVFLLPGPLRWASTDQVRQPGPGVYHKIDISTTKTMVDLGEVRTFHLTLETNAASAISPRGHAINFYARVTEFSMTNGNLRYTPLVMEYHQEPELEHMEQFLRDTCLALEDHRADHFNPA